MINNPRIYANYKIFVAEVASTTNELLLNHYLLENSQDDKEKLTILNNLMNLYYATLVRQTMFAEFELKSYQLREENKPITHEILEEEYYNLCKKYFKDTVVMDDEIKYEWERIPHFYYGFYVYKYATSLAASTVIANNILTEKGFVDKYIKFLSSGGSMDPLDELKIVDVDLSKKEVIDKAMDQFNYYIEEFKKLYQKVEGK
jgi:oligoendopeptidase F